MMSTVIASSRTEPRTAAVVRADWTSHDHGAGNAWVASMNSRSGGLVMTGG